VLLVSGPSTLPVKAMHILMEYCQLLVPNSTSTAVLNQTCEKCVFPYQESTTDHTTGLEMGEQHLGQKKIVVDRQLARKVVQAVENLCAMRHFTDMCDS